MLLALAALIAFAYLKGEPQDLPWTKLDLKAPVGMFTGRKITALQGEFGQCQILLEQAGISYEAPDPVGENQCRRDQHIKLTNNDKKAVRFDPVSLAPSCPVAAALAVWEQQVVQPYAEQVFGQRVKTIRHLGSYNCRKIGGSDQWSEHATGNAVDIAAFVLADGRTISILKDWDGKADEVEFLASVRDGACGLFSTVLSPDYNAAHADHFHLDQAPRGAMGFRVCR